MDLMKSVRQGRFILPSKHYRIDQIPDSIKFVMKLEDLHAVAPNIMHSVKLVYMPPNVYSIDEEMYNWLNPFVKAHPFFGPTKDTIALLYDYMTKPLLNILQLHENRHENNLLINRRYFLKIFFHYLTIFMYELFKLDLCHAALNLAEPSPIPTFFRTQNKTDVNKISPHTKQIFRPRATHS
jgi:hypothetical protein